jgi:hypothetical protein
MVELVLVDSVEPILVEVGEEEEEEEEVEEEVEVEEEEVEE